ncbi:MAG: orotate phosphoribosyltransferase [Gammaproteobacteria bacterium TMED112]|nr:MAG: orotate phosphoribosyltransferase [Gammaproteobacteria bacterium TMED112]
MKDYQKNFIRLALKANALKFGDFTLKSGRKSPYFFNASAFIEYGALDELAEILAAKVKDSNLKFDMIFGPAYKGIFLASILATKLSKEGNMPICFNRKEIKDHGEGGTLIGAIQKGNVLIIDDVVSSGLAIREALTFLNGNEVNICGALVTLDRQEKGQSSMLKASSELKKEGLDVFSIISLDDLLSANEVIDKDILKSIRIYRDEFGGEDV